jgi:site-specific recombinase XerD
MPKYSKSDIRYTIREVEFNAILRATKSLRDQTFLSILYCTGARPSEISGDKDRNKKGMSYGDIVFADGSITFNVPVSKLRKNEYAIEKRPLTLEFDPDNMDLPIKLIMRYVLAEYKRCQKNKTDFDPKKQMFDFTRRTGYNIVDRVGKKLGMKICPYNFRHSRLTQLSEQGAGIETLMYFKGSKDIKSIQPYLHAKEIRFKLKKEK